MFKIGKIIALLVLSRTIPSKISLAQKFLSIVATVAGIAIVTAVLISAVIIGSLYYVYLTLLGFDLSQDMSMAITAAITLAIIFGLSYLIMHKVEDLNELPSQFLEAESPVAYRTNSVVESFMNGLRNRDYQQN